MQTTPSDQTPCIAAASTKAFMAVAPLATKHIGIARLRRYLVTIAATVAIFTTTATDALTMDGQASSNKENQTQSRSAFCPPLQEVIETTALTEAEFLAALEKDKERALKQLDWVAQDGINSCDGYYQPADFTLQASSAESDTIQPTDTIEMFSDSLVYQSDSLMNLEGNILFNRDNLRLSCDRIQYDANADSALAQGNVIFRSEDALILAESADIFQQSDANFIDSRFVLYPVHARGSAAEVRLINNAQDNQAVLRDSEFSLCPPTQNDWAIRASELTLDQVSGWGKAWHMRFLIKDTPVFYFPYVTFPIDDRRKTGFLLPLIGGGSDGFSYQQSYYLNLAPHYDLTYSPHFIEKHGVLNILMARYKHTSSEWQLTGSQINNDKRIDGDDIDSSPLYDDDDRKRWGISLIESGQFLPNLRHSINYTDVSDVDFLRDWHSSALNIDNTEALRRTASLSFSSTNWQSSLKAIDFKSLEINPNTGKAKDEDYSLLPELSLSFVNSRTTNRLNPFFTSYLSQFAHDTKAEALRSHTEAGVSYGLSELAYEVEAKLKAEYNFYDYNDSNDPAITDFEGEPYQGSDSVSVFGGSIFGQLNFERQFDTEAALYSHSLSPKLQYSYASYDNQDRLLDLDTSERKFNYNEVFRESRFSGYDRIGDNNKLSLGLDTEIFDILNGQSIWSLGIAQAWYLQDRRLKLKPTDDNLLTINPDDDKDTKRFKKATNKDIDKRFFREYSDIALQSSYWINPQQSAKLQLVLDPDNGELARGSIAWQYRNENNLILNLEVEKIANLPKLQDTDSDASTPREFVNFDDEFVNLSGYLPLSLTGVDALRDWSAFTRVEYDLNKNEPINDLAGFSYSNCCWKLYFIAENERREFENGQKVQPFQDSRYKRNWYIEVELTGLAGATNRVIRLLEENIQGFNQ
ncbi:MAG: LPS assembly protein LptD [Pseudomonadales bacterium]|nr:LPS assembly protein LptD [Pseudomonadales bacterium]